MAVLKLIGLEGPFRGKSRMLPEGEYMMGRNGCAISIPDPKVSSIHAKLNVTSDHVTIEDVDSLNGIYVNDPQKANRVYFEELHDKDTFALGPDTVFGIRYLEFRAAGFWKRIFARLLDVLILLPVLVIGAALIWVLVGRPAIATDLQNLELGWLESSLNGIWTTIVLLFYFAGMHGWKGQTVGKMALGIKVVRTDGNKVSYGTAVSRQLLLDSAIGIGVGIIFSQADKVAGLGDLVALIIFAILLSIHPQKRGWHDLLADTRVVEVEKG